MTKSYDPALLEPTLYPFEIPVSTRFGDLDPNGHINNVALAVAFEDARVRFSRANLTDGVLDTRTMIVANYIDYLAQAYYPQPLHIHFGVDEIGRSSWNVALIAVQDGTVVALNRAVLVHSDGQRAMPMPQPMREKLQAFRLRRGDTR
jgi:acyl-CoA thioester hydrolase